MLFCSPSFSNGSRYVLTFTEIKIEKAVPKHTILLKNIVKALLKESFRFCSPVLNVNVFFRFFFS